MGSAESHHENCTIEESQEFKYKKRDYYFKRKFRIENGS